ncbi:MAG: hypothetical protein IKH19_00010 [Muribaculaceae bacterium]|nr:hypothetical protein [Muribaculaceae bacterium]
MLLPGWDMARGLAVMRPVGRLVCARRLGVPFGVRAAGRGRAGARMLAFFEKPPFPVVSAPFSPVPGRFSAPSWLKKRENAFFLKKSAEKFWRFGKRLYLCIRKREKAAPAKKIGVPAKKTGGKLARLGKLL